MADKISLTKENVRYIRDAFSHFFPEDTIYSADKPYVSGEFNWNNRKSFIDFIYRLTGVQIKSDKDFQNIKKAEQVVEGLVEGGEKKAEKNIQTKEEREEAERVRAEREASQKKAKDDAVIQVEAAIKKQQELAEAVKNTNVYVKTTLPKPANLTDDQAKSIETLKTAAKGNPTKLSEDLIKTIKEKIGPSFPSGVTPAETDVIIQQTAFRIVTNLQGKSLAKEAVTEKAISQNGNVLSKVIKDPNTLNPFSFSAMRVSNSKIFEFVFTRRIASAAFGEDFVDNVFGPEKLSDIKVELSATPKEGFEAYSLPEIPKQYTDSLQNTESFIESLHSFAEGEIKSQLLSHVGVWLDTQVAKLPVDSFLAQAYNSELVQMGLSYFGLGTPVAWEGSTFVTRIAIQNGFGPVLGWVQNVTGLNLGVTQAITTVGGEVAGDAIATTAVTQVGTEVAAEVAAGTAQTVGATVGTGAGLAIGQLVVPLPVIGATLGLAFTWIVKQVSKIIPWDKIKKFFSDYGGVIGVGLLGGGYIIGSAPVMVASIPFLYASWAGVRSFSRFGRNIGNGFKVLGTALLVRIGTPILVAIIILPVIVAFILFIINSGAYIVPPTGALAGLQNPYIGIEKTANPAGPFVNSDIPSKTKVTYTVTVTAKKGPLTNIIFKDECKVIKNGLSPPCPTPSEPTPTPPASISPSSPFTFSYVLDFNSHTYDDSAIVNTFTVTADAIDQTGITFASSASVVIGNPPMECPNLAWPLANDEGLRSITQGSMTPAGWTHNNVQNAIDIGVNGATIVAMHSGTVSIGEAACGGKWVKVASSCGSPFSSYYGHLGAITVSDGQKVTVGQTLGISDNTGSCTTGAHLHFQFFDTGNVPVTQKPYLKRDVPLGCTNQPGNLCN